MFILKFSKDGIHHVALPLRNGVLLDLMAKGATIRFVIPGKKSITDEEVDAWRQHVAGPERKLVSSARCGRGTVKHVRAPGLRNSLYRSST